MYRKKLNLLLFGGIIVAGSAIIIGYIRTHSKIFSGEKSNPFTSVYKIEGI